MYSIITTLFSLQIKYDDDAWQNGYVYLVDYALLQDIPTVRRDADHRYVAAPIVLLYVRRDGHLVPLAIQLRQQPGHNNPIWTPRDRPENWILAKLWVQNADFQWQFAISHLFRCVSALHVEWLVVPRQSKLAGGAVCPVSVTFVYCVETAKDTVVLL